MPRKAARVRTAVVFLTLAFVAFAAIKFVSYAQKRSAPAAPTSVAVTDSIAFAPGGDVNLNTKANPGDKLEGTITVSASGSAATGTKVSIPISSLLTLDNTFGTNGMMVTPLVANDTYAATGNITISQPTGAGSLLSNDIDPVSGNNTGLTATAQTISSASCTGGCSGNVVINADGSFTYVSPPNFTGADTFVYTVTSSNGGTATGTATVNVADRIVFVSAAGGGNCRPATPCSLATADALAAPTTGKDLVFVLSGTYSTAAFTMNASQNLVGQGVSLAQALTDAGITLATNSINPSPSFTASTSPILNNGATIITLSTNNLVERFALNPSGAAAPAGILGNAIASGTSTIRDLSSTATTSARAISLTSNTGATFNLSGITLAAGSIALNATGGGTINISNSNASSINASGQAINANGVTLAATFTSVTASGGTNGIALTNVAGTSNFGTGSLSGSSGVEFLVSGGNPSLAYGGTITQTTGAHAIDIQSTTGGGAAFSGAITSNNGTGQGIFLNSNNAASTFSFTGGVAISTGVNPGFTATSSGTVSATQNNTTIVNTLATTTGTALNVANTTIAASGLVFRSISANGGANGIVLNTTGAVGGLTVTGNGGLCDSAHVGASDCTGGSIQSTSGSGVDLRSTNSASLTLMHIFNNASSASTFCATDLIGGNNLGCLANVYLQTISGVTLDKMVITGSKQQGINGNNITGFTLTNSDVKSNGTGGFSADGGITIQSLKGTATVNNDNLIDNNARQMYVANIGSETLTLNTASTSYSRTVDGGSATGQGLLLDLYGTSNTTFTGNLLTFSHSQGLTQANAFQLNINANATMPASSISNSTFDLQAAGIDVTSGSNGAVTFNSLNNTINHNAIQGIIYGFLGAAGNGSLTGTIQGNQIGNTAIGCITAGSSCAGISINSGNGWFGQMHLLVDNNIVRQVTGGILLTIDGSASAGTAPTAAVKITRNTVNTPLSGAADVAIRVTGGTTSANPNLHGCWDVGGTGVQNTVSGNWALGGADAGVQFRQRFTGNASWVMPGYGGSSTDDTAVQNYVNGRNFITAPVGPPAGVQTLATHSGVTPYAGGSCATPSAPMSGFADVIGRSGANYRGIADPAIDEDIASLIESSLNAGVKPSSPADLGTKAEIALAEPVENVLGGIAQAEVINAPRQQTTEEQPSLITELYNKLTSSVEPTAYAQETNTPDAPSATVTVDGGGAGFTIPAGASITIKYRATVNNAPPSGFASGVDTIDNQATATGSFGTVTSSPITSLALDAAPDLSVTSSDSVTTTQPGATNSYTLTYSNGLGSAANNLQQAAGATVSATIPANTTFNAGASSGGGGWTCAPNNNAGSVCTNNITGPIAVNTAAAIGTLTFAVDVAQLPPAATTKIDLVTASIAENPANFNGTDLNTANNAAATDSDNIIGVWNGTGTNWTATGSWSNGVVPTTQNVAIPPDATNAPSIPAATAITESKVFLAKDLTIGAGSTLTATSTFSLGANKVLGTGTLIIDNGATITRTTGQVNCPLQKNFSGGAIAEGVADPNSADALAAIFTFPVGTAAGYFPVDVTPTGGSTGSLTVQSFDNPTGTMAGLDPTKTLGRFWTLTGGSGITADVKFSYGPINGAPPPGTKVNGNEANYKPQFVVGGVATSFADNCAPGTSCVDQTNHFIFVPNRTTFAGNWTASELAPTAAQVGVSGRVLSANGQALRGVRVTLDDGTGHAMTMITNAFGYYRFDEVQSGGSYLLNATARGYIFTPRVVSVNDSLTDVDITALP